MYVLSVCVSVNVSIRDDHLSFVSGYHRRLILDD